MGNVCKEIYINLNVYNVESPNSLMDCVFLHLQQSTLFLIERILETAHSFFFVAILIYKLHKFEQHNYLIHLQYTKY